MRHLSQVRSRYQPGDIVTLTLLSPDGNLVDHKITLQNYPVADRLTFLFIPYFIGLVYLECSLWVFRQRRKTDVERAFALLAASTALAIASLFDTYTSNVLTSLWTIAIVLAGGAFFHLSLLFPQEVHLVIRYPFLKWLGYIAWQEEI